MTALPQYMVYDVLTLHHCGKWVRLPHPQRVLHGKSSPICILSNLIILGATQDCSSDAKSPHQCNSTSVLHDQLDIFVHWVARLVLVPERFKSVIELLVDCIHVLLLGLHTKQHILSLLSQ